MESIFDRLARELSREERRSLLTKIGESQDLNEEPMRLDEVSANEPVILDREFAELSFFARLRIVLLGFFTGRGRHKLTEEFLLHKIQRKVERGSSGLFDFNRELVSPKMHDQIARLKSAMDVFHRPMMRALEGDKPDFYALLAKLEFEDIIQRLETETNPYHLEEEAPGSLPSEIKKKMDSVFEMILGDIIPDRRRRMSAHTTALARLRTLTRYPYDRILALFPPSDQGAAAAASLRQLKDPLLELGDALYAFRSPPATTLLESLFLFELQDILVDESSRLELELTERMDRAAAALDIIRKINSDIPWGDLLKALAEDLRYSPRPVGGGEDWFHVFKTFWKNRLAVRYRAWAEKKRQAELLRGLTALWGLEIIAEIPGYRANEFPENIQPRHNSSFAATLALFLEVFQGRLYHSLNLIMIDGKFYKKDNRREFEEVYGRFLKTPDKVRALVTRLRPDGEFGIRQADLRRLAASGENIEDKMKDHVRSLDRESQNLVVPIIGDLKAMSRLLKGILDGNGGTYDTLSNMAEIGGQGHKTFRMSLQEVGNIIQQSSELLSDLVSLEEKRIAP